jgi:hypothetical protein
VKGAGIGGVKCVSEGGLVVGVLALAAFEENHCADEKGYGT